MLIVNYKWIVFLTCKTKSKIDISGLEEAIGVPKSELNSQAEAKASFVTKSCQRKKKLPFLSDLVSFCLFHISYWHFSFNFLSSIKFK